MQGTQIGPFLVGSKLGRKKRNSVYRAWQVEQDRAVALKFIKVPPVVSLPRAMGRLRRESSILRQLNHPNLVRFHGTGMENGKFFFAMDLIEGESLAAILSRRNKLAWELAWDYARQIACCLEYLHSREMMHLKLMPDKILITKEGQVKITDHRLNRKKRKRWDS
ncbi:protein kinase, partial [Pirellulaceae bacterium]|nr:protein kinase [Pirellulaceae bacterium]